MQIFSCRSIVKARRGYFQEISIVYTFLRLTREMRILPIKVRHDKMRCGIFTGAQKLTRWPA